MNGFPPSQTAFRAPGSAKSPHSWQFSPLAAQRNSIQAISGSGRRSLLPQPLPTRSSCNKNGGSATGRSV